MSRSYRSRRLRILIVGCGDVGLRAARLLAGRARCFGVLRGEDPTDQSRADKLRAAGVIPIRADLDDRSSLQRLAGLASHILHLAPPPGEGERDPRSRRLLAALSTHATEPKRRRSLSPPTLRLAYVSTSGIYGDCGGAQVDESRPARPNNLRAKRRVDAEQQLRAFGRRGHTVSLLRAPGIYASDRMPAERVKKGLPAIVSADDVHTNHIHADDLARLAITALFRGRANRAYNAVDDSGLKMGDWFDLVADHLGLPRPPRLPRDQVIAAVTPAMRSFLTESRRLVNKRIKQELRFRLRYPTVREGLKSPPGSA